MGLLFSAKNVTVWKIDIATTKSGKEYARLQCSTQKKNKQSGTYETDWSGVVDFWNGAYDKFKASNIQVKDRINILNGQHTNTYSKESKRTFENYNIWAGEDYEIVTREPSNVEEPKQQTQSVMEDLTEVDMDEFPF